VKLRSKNPEPESRPNGPRPPFRRRISPELSTGVLAVVVLAVAGLVAGPTLAGSTTTVVVVGSPVADPGGVDVAATPPLPSGTESPAVVATLAPTPAPPTPEPTPAPTPEPTPPPTPEPTVPPTPGPVDPHVDLVLKMNAHLASLADELRTAARASSPDVAHIANTLSRVAAGINVAADAAHRFPTDLAPLGNGLLAAYGVITKGDRKSVV
jgi:hypothetical protein